MSAFSLFLNPLELKLDLDRWDCSRRSACQQVFTEFRQRQQLGRAVAVGSGSRLGNVEVEYRAVRARDAATKAQHGRPLRRVVMHREDQAAQQRAPVDAVIPRGGRTRKRSERPATVTTKSCLWFRCRHAERRVPSGACQVDVEVTRARTAVRDAHAAKIDLRKALKKASLKHTLACGVTKSDQSSSPSVARTCSATRLNSPLQRYCACLRAILDSLTGWAGWYARRQ